MDQTRVVNVALRPRTMTESRRIEPELFEAARRVAGQPGEPLPIRQIAARMWPEATPQQIQRVRRRQVQKWATGAPIRIENAARLADALGVRDAEDILVRESVSPDERRLARQIERLQRQLAELQQELERSRRPPRAGRDA